MLGYSRSTWYAMGIFLLTCLLCFGDATYARKGRWVAQQESGVLLVANASFPTSAEDDNDLVRKGRKHSKQNKPQWSSGSELTLHFLMVLKRKFGSDTLYLVLYKSGDKTHIEAQQLQIKPTTTRLVSPVSFSGTGLKNGTRYELRAIRLQRRGKAVNELIIARTTFRL